MIKFIDINGLHFVGKFNELIYQLSAIENKEMTLREYVLSCKSKLN
jgi:hypothetical protein